MAIYATEADLRAYVSEALNAQFPADIERLLEGAERRVDALAGPHEHDAVTGLKFDPAALTAPQKAALSRACCAAAEFEMVAGPSVLVGTDDYITGGEHIAFTLIRRATRTPPKVIEELCSVPGLYTVSGCATPTPAPTPPPSP